MCFICVELTQGTLTPLEARENLREMHTEISKEHMRGLLSLIWKMEDSEDLSSVGSD
jgi:hypothetical protein|tara:strand:+ start:417 stop:587 length:171 start_codon:yes stop_codon:yes gene_type:complete